MRTLFGTMRRVRSLAGRPPLLRRVRGDVGRVARVRPLGAGRRPLLTDRLGEQRRGGVRLDQVDGSTCASAVLIALAAWADPTELRRLDGDRVAGAAAGSGGGSRSVAGGTRAELGSAFGARYDARQRQVHRESTRFWPQALGTTPWGMTRWLRRHVPAAGPYRVRMVDDTSPADLGDAMATAEAVLGTGRPVPMLVGALVPRHYALALGLLDDGAWRVYEPTSGQVRALDPGLVRRRRLAGVLGAARLHALLLPA
jgi:hypothetical protein